MRARKQRLHGLAAEVAYNTMLAMFPAILAVLTSVALVESSAHTLGGIADQLARVMPKEVLTLTQAFIQEITHVRNQGLFSLSFIVSLWAASGAVGTTMAALDHIYQTPPAQMRPFWRAKLVSLGLMVGTILLLLTASLLIFVSEVAIRLLAEHGGDFVQSWVLTGWQWLSLPLALAIVMVAFAFIYRFGPSQWRSGTPILPGALLAALFWAIFSRLFSIYVTRFGQYSRVYGAIAAVIVLLIWLYLSSLMLLLGAQMNVVIGEAMQAERRRKRWR